MSEINPEIKRWFIERCAQQPEYLATVFLPEIEKTLAKGEVALRQALRADDIQKIKYRCGWLDGVQEVASILSGMRLSEGKEPAEPGLVARIFSRINGISSSPSNGS